MRGLVYIAHDNGLFDYGTMTYCSALTARHHLDDPPIALITDRDTWEALLEKHPMAEAVFMEPIFVPELNPEANTRTFKVGFEGTPKKAPYHNGTRAEIFDLSPFDETLMVDSDVLILDGNLKGVWGSNNDLMINKSIGRMMHPHSMQPFMQRLDDVTIPTYWATITYFKRSKPVSNFFRVVEKVRENFHYYGLLYRFQTDLYRNDYAFSVAAHAMSGYLGAGYEFAQPLPTPHLTFAWDQDTLVDVERGKALFLVSQGGQQFPVALRETVHCMNKQSMLAMADKIIEVYG